jgi:hypothetical protein
VEGKNKIKNKEYHLQALTCINFSANALKITLMYGSFPKHRRESDLLCSKIFSNVPLGSI